MARVTNGFLGNFTTTDELTAKFPPSEYAGCSANIGSVAPYSKAWSDGSTWNALASAPIQALVSGDGVLSLRVGDVSAATANTAAIRAAVAAGSCRVMGPGTVFINDTIWLDNGQALETGPGVTLKLAPASNKLMVGTAPLQESATTVTVTWTNGITASIAWTAHGRAVGDVVALQGANEVQWNTMYRVASVTDANNFVVTLAEFMTAAPTGTITAKRCVRNIKAVVSLDYDYANNPSAAAGVNRHACVIAFAADILAENLRVTAANLYKYGLNTCATLNVRGSVHGIAAGDICKLYGPARDTVLSVSGTSRDDCASFQAKEPPAFIAYMPAFGPIKDCGLSGISVSNAGGTSSGAVVVYADPDHEIDNITIENGSAISNLNEGIAIKYGDTFSSGKIGSVTIRDMAFAGLVDDYAFAVSATVDALNIVRPRIMSSTSAASNAIQLLRFESTTTIRALRVEGLMFNEAEWPSSGAASYLVNLNGAIYQAEFVGCSIRGRSSQARFITLGTNGVQSVALRGCDFENLSQVGIVNDGGSVIPKIIMDGNRFKTVTAGWDIRDDAIVVMRGNTFDTMSNGVVRPTTNARTVSVYDEGGNTYASASAITCVAPGTATPYGYLPVDIGATGITKASGASAFNTGTGRGTVPQNRPVVCDGTSWFNATNLSHTF